MDGPSSMLKGKRLIVATGRARRLAVQSHQDELKMLLSSHHMGQHSEIRKTIGDVAAGLLVGGKSNAAFLVFQAANDNLDI